MAQTTKRLRVTELDFNDIKTNLKSYMKSQETFKDYDFECGDSCFDDPDGSTR